MQNNRINQLRSYLKNNNLDFFLLHHPSSLRYFFGFTGSNGLGFLTDKSIFFLTDFRYAEKASTEVYTDEVICADSPLIDSIVEMPVFRENSHIGFESEFLSYRDYSILKKNASHKLVPCEEVTGTISSVKSAEEIQYIKHACEITVAVYNDIQPILKEGCRELDIAAKISYLIKKMAVTETHLNRTFCLVKIPLSLMEFRGILL